MTDNRIVDLVKKALVALSVKIKKRPIARSLKKNVTIIPNGL